MPSQSPNQKRNSHFYLVCLELYVVALILGSSFQQVSAKIDTFVGRMAALFVNGETDLVKLHRLSALYMMLLQIARLNNDKSAKTIEAAYLDYENGLKYKDANSEFEFLKPFFKERFTTTLSLAPKCKLRTFLYNLAVTGDYYGKKLVAAQNGFYTQYFNLLCFSFYKQMVGIWPSLSHFTTQTIAKSKSQSERHEFAILALVRFINCYAENGNLQEGTPDSLKSYLGHLAQMLSTAVSRTEGTVRGTFDLEALLLFKASLLYDVEFYEEQNSRLPPKLAGRRFDFSEFVEVLDKHVPIQTLRACPDFQALLELLYCPEPSEKRLLLFDRVRDTFQDEPVHFTFRVKNKFRVG